MGNELTTRPQHTFSDLTRMAEAVAKSNLFGVKDANQALTLMLIAQEEGTGVASAARDFHIIEGRPALKVDAMLARFQAAGGRVEWHELSGTKAEATFTHPTGGSIKLEWTIEQAKAAGLIRNNRDGSPGVWMRYPRAMLRSRLVSEGIRTVYPGSIVGVYTPEELADEPTERDITPRGEKSEVELSRKTEDEVIDVETATPEGDSRPPPTPEPQMDPSAVADHLAAIEAAATLDDMKTAHAKAYTAAHAAADGKAMLRFEVAKKTAKHRLTKAGAAA